MWCGVISIFGYAALAYVLYQVVQLVTQLTRPPKDLSKYGEYSIVTGPTSGIGKAIAFELAKRGQNLILVGRNPTKLENVQKDINKASPKCKIITLQIDLSQFDEDAQTSFKDTINKYNVGILINNAGLAYQYTQYFDEVSVDRIRDMIEVNSKTPMLMSRFFIDKLYVRSKSNNLPKMNGCIVNISSAGSIVPHELHCVYSGTKAFLNKFTLDLGLEYDKKGIACQVQLPYFVVSAMSKIRKPSLTTPSAADYAKYSVNQIGYSGLLSPYPVHAIIFFVLNFVPKFVLEKFIGNMHHVIRKKGHKKFNFKKD